LTSTAKRMAACLVLASAASGSATNASGQPIAPLVAAAATGQFGARAPSKAEVLMARARDALSHGDLAAAERFVADAEAAGAGDARGEPYADSPAKLRREIAAVRGDFSRGSPAGRSAPALKPTHTPVDPFVAARSKAAGGASANPAAKKTAQTHLSHGRDAVARRDFMSAIDAYRQAVSQNATFERGEYSPADLAAELKQNGVMVPAMASATAGHAPAPTAEPPLAERRPESRAGGLRPLAGSFGPSERAPGPAPRPRAIENRTIENTATRSGGALSAEQAQQQTYQLLKQARVSIAAGDTANAAKLIREVETIAERANVRFTEHQDSPVRVQQLIARVNQIAQAPNVGSDDVVFTRHFAQVLVEQADWLARYGEPDRARDLAQRAKEMGAEFAPGALTPDMILAKLDGRPAPQPRTAPATHRSAVHPNKAEATALAARAQAALDRGRPEEAYQLALAAQRLGVPGDQFGPEDINPSLVLMRIERETDTRRASTAVYRPHQDFTRNQPAAFDRFAQADGAAVPAPAPVALSDDPRELMAQGQAALERQDLAGAIRLFREAWKHEDQLDPRTRQRLQDHLQLVRLGEELPAPRRPVSPLAQLDQAQQVAYRKLLGEMAEVKAEARSLARQDPLAALNKLEQLRVRVQQSELTPAVQQRLLTAVDIEIQGARQFVEANRERIAADQDNRDARESIERRYANQAAVDHKLAELVDEFNLLMDQERYAEAEVLARQAREIAPENEVTIAMTWKSRFVSRMRAQMAVRSAKEEGFVIAMHNVEKSSIPFDDNDPYALPDVRTWEMLSKSRRARFRNQDGRISPAELKIRTALSQPVDVRFNNRPLAEVVGTLAAMTGINIVLDQQGLATEGVTSDEPVALNLTESSISLGSALNLILQPRNLSYVIQNEVLLITSAQMRDADVVTYVYDVADLVIPIPNFVPSHDIGLPGAIASAYAATGYGALGGMAPNLPPTYLAGGAAAPGGSVLAQMGGAGGAGPLGSLMGGSRPSQPAGFGPGGLGGGSAADFDTLIDLITSTIAPTTWSDVGGPGSIEGFETNLSLVVSQTQEVHEDIVDLLEQLRRLQDLQVTIEVRFITLNDNFFERIGVDFDFDIDDGLNTEDPDDVPQHGNPTVTIGLDPLGQPTADLDLQFTQGSFGSAVPQFGGFDAATAANFGFAIISEIEAFFVIQAAQGDTRTNVMQSPKVTLFNGQQAFVSDTSQRPFVTSVVPVVGDFAAAQQPVIVVLSEGTSLSVQAVVSPDRRFVRLTLIPFFSRIGEVEEFTFQGSSSSDSGTAIADPSNDDSTIRQNESRSTNGTTVQLPTFSFVTVTTTVSVPDGGTVLLGGIKRLSEGRNERGVPVLSKVPYINRLFRNVGIGRTTQSLMMMVTPRIIIQEEEEEKIGLPPPP